MKIEIISNINMDSLKFYMKDYSFISECAFGNYMLDLLDKNSTLYKSESEFIILFIDINELKEDINELLHAVAFFINNSSKPIILNTVCYLPFYLDTFLHYTLENELMINQKILEFSKKHINVLLFDFLKLIKQNNFYDEKFWYLGKIKFSNVGFEKIAFEIDKLIKTYRYGSKKVLVLDLDNTLWGGIIGEEEIKLSNDGIGSIYFNFQKNIKKLKDYGILLTINSKNNYKDGIKGLNHPNSILNEDDFIIKKINWNDKATNLKEISSELNLGFESFVFIEDNPVERNLIKQTLPEVTVPDFPEDIFYLNTWFIKIVEENFARISLTKEDLAKQEQYVAKIKRDKLSKEVLYEDFLKSLDIKLKFYIDDDRFIERYAQMTQKTNQFNLTTKRYNIKDIAEFIKNSNSKVIAVEYKDKFASEGITGLTIVKEKSDSVEIDTFLLSCRIIKRGVEKVLIKKILQLYPNKDIIGKYFPTKKNMQTKNLYINYGFNKIDKNTFIKKRR